MIQKQKTKMIGVHLPELIIEELDKKAAEEYTNRSEIVRRMILKVVKNE